MVTKEEWNKEISKIRKCLDNWTFGVDLKVVESEFIADILDEMVYELNYADWDFLQKHLKEIDEEDEEDKKKEDKRSKKL
jgi:hypothetical protein